MWIIEKPTTMKILTILKEHLLNKTFTGQDVVANMYYKYRISSYNKPIIITFPPNRDIINNDPCISPFNFDFLCRYDVNILCFGVLGAHKDNYFMHPEFSIFIEKLGASLSPFKLRLGYANSKGGFGIGAYSEALNLDYALLFHPVSTKNQSIVPWDTQATTYASQHLDWSGPYSDVNIGKCQGFVIYDPLNEIDLKHAARFSSFRKIKVYGYGHGQGYYFLSLNTDVIKNLIHNFINNQTVDIRRIRKDFKVLRLTKHYYIQMLKTKPNNKKLTHCKNKIEKILKSPAVTGKKRESGLEKKHSEIAKKLIESALYLESINTERALTIMEIALNFSSQDLIKRKISNYKSQLKAINMKIYTNKEGFSIKSKSGNYLYFDKTNNTCINSVINDKNLPPIILKLSKSKKVDFFTFKDNLELVPLFLSENGLNSRKEKSFKSKSRLIEAENGYFLIKTDNFYLCAEPSGKVLSNRYVASNWERFKIYNLDDA